MTTSCPISNLPRSNLAGTTDIPRGQAEAAFGHAAADYAVALAGRAGARRVALFHHRPDRTDDALDELGRRFAAGSVPVMVAAEGRVLDLLFRLDLFFRLAG